MVVYESLQIDVQRTCLSGVVGEDERAILPVRNRCSTGVRSRARPQRLRRLHLDLTRACADLRVEHGVTHVPHLAAVAERLQRRERIHTQPNVKTEGTRMEETDTRRSCY
jgi:hypothetical protein